MDEDKMREHIAERLGVEGLEKEEQLELIDEVMDALLQRVFFATMEKLGDEDRSTLTNLVEDDDTSAEVMNTFLHGSIDDYDAFLDNTIEAFFTDMDKAVAEDASSEEAPHVDDGDEAEDDEEEEE